MQISSSPNPASPVGNTTNFSIVASETVYVGPITITKNGSVLNLTSYTAQMIINTPNPIVLNTTNGGITIPTPANGQIFINMTSSATLAIPPGTYAYAASYTDGSGNVTAFLGGTFSVQQAIAL